MNLLEILNCFESPLNEEQTWAVCYQCVKFLKQKTDCGEIQLYAPLGVKSLILSDEGYVSIEGKEAENCSVVVKNLGLALFAALDYGVAAHEEQELSPSLEYLISSMTGILSNDDDDDEGYDDYKAQGDVGSLDYVIQLCEEHLSSSFNVDDHYLDVCKTLVNKAQELKIFLSKVASAEESLRNLPPHLNHETSEDTYPCLNFVDWAQYWIQVLDELRHGVARLRKVEKQAEESVEYELTPYENLMKEIRQKKFTLKKVTRTETLPSLTRKSAHDVILDFIRSRPNLSPAHQRVLAPTPPRSKSLHERLIEQIQEQSIPLKPVISTDLGWMKPSKTFDVGHSIKCHTNDIPTLQSRRKLKAPTAEELNFDGELNETYENVVVGTIDDSLYTRDHDVACNNSFQQFARSSNPASLRSSGTSGVSSLLDDDSDTPTKISPFPTRLSDSVRRKRLPLELPPSPISPPPEETSNPKSTFMGSILSSFLQGSAATTGGLRRSQSVAIRSPRVNENLPVSSAELKRQKWRTERKKAQAATTILPPPTCSSSPVSFVSPFQRTYSERRTFTKQENKWRHPADSLSLTVEEVMHIRQVLSRAQMEKFQSTKGLYEALKNEKICFHCQVKKFGLFAWPYTCQICKRKVCNKCIKKIRAPTDKYFHTPISTLSPDLKSSILTDSNFQSDKALSDSPNNLLRQQRNNVSTPQLWSLGRKIDVCIDCNLLISGVVDTNQQSAFNTITSK